MKSLFLFILLSFFCYKITCAQPGKIDPSFGTNGTVTTNILSLPGFTTYKSTIIQPDGKVLAMGDTYTNTYTPDRGLALVRYNKDGSLDNTFSGDGKVTDESITYNAMAIQKDGKIVLAGSAVARYNIDGSLDLSFSGGKIVIPSFYFSSIAIQKDGRIVAAGFAGDPDPDNEDQDFAVVRFNTNGTLDSTFSGDGKAVTHVYDNDKAKAVVIQDDEKILIGGTSGTTYKDYVNYFTLVRYTTSGALDASFNNSGIVLDGDGENRDVFGSLALQKDGKILVAGVIETISLERFNSNGIIDSSYGNAGLIQTGLQSSRDFIPSYIRDDESLLVAGSRPNVSSFAVARYTKTGVLDTGFNLQAIENVSAPKNYYILTSLAVFNNRLYLGGYEESSSVANGGGSGVVAVYKQNNKLDTSFGVKGIVKTDFGTDRGTTEYTGSAVQSNGKIVVVGNIYEDNITELGIARYNTNGDLDTTFSNDGKQVTEIDDTTHIDNVGSVAIQKDGKIVIAASVVSDYANQSIAVFRYNTNGSADTTFGTAGRTIKNFRIGGYVKVNQVILQQDGKIVLAGGIDDYIAVIRYNTDGTFDTTFDGDGVKTTLVDNSLSIGYSVAIQTDGKILVAGTAGVTVNVGNTPHFAIIRYNTNGSLDNSFSNDGIQTTAFAYFDYARSIAVQADGKILVAGYSYHYPDNKYDYILVRYNKDGSIDNSFGNNGKQMSYDQYNAFATSVSVLDNGNILVGGFVEIDGTTKLGFRNYYSNGNVNLNFDSEPKPTADVRINFLPKLSLANGRFYVVGTANGFFGSGLLSRYFLEDNKAPAVSITNPVNNATYTAPAAFPLTATASDPDGTITSVQFYNGSILLKADSTSPYSFAISDLPPGNYSFVAKATDNNGFTNNSATVAVAVLPSPNKGPVVSITSPLANQAYPASSNITINATAVDQGGAIANVKFYEGSTLLAVDSSSPYSYTIVNATAGSYTLYAEATDNSGLKNSSATIVVFVANESVNKAPVVNITSPANNASYPAVATIVLHATASDTDGTITSVEFFSGSTLLKTDSTSPYSCSISQPPAGRYSFVAKAIDNKGLTNNSATVTVGVGGVANKAPAVKLSSPVNNANFIAPATITLNAVASDADGTVKSVQFYNGLNLLKTDSAAPYSFTINNAIPGNYKFYAKATDNNGLVNSSSTISAYVLHAPSNKAPVVKLNNPVNNEVHYAPATIYMNAAATDEDGTISNVKFYMGSTLLATDSIPPYIYTLTNLPVGNYSFVAKATDNNGLQNNSATAIVPVLARPNKAPVVNIISPENNAIYSAPANIILNATASDADGTIMNVKFYKGSALLKTVTTAPYTFTINNVTAGSYRFYAKVADNNGLTNSSETICVAVSAAPNNENPAATASKANGKPSPVAGKTVNTNAITVKLAPNPAHDILTIYPNGLQTNNKLAISILSASGVAIKTIQTGSSNQNIQLNVSSLTSGMYIIKITAADKILYSRFIKF